ncbi:hypothetical protein [Phreatobacter stygius]|uniref:Transmembrane protein n=1 Tax=Phreatobacter stygius TaxID=1940610 RepID=A0A4D7ASA0_9HYPH|nr:hypothetical protein [Phreatobacter stygius]QCI63839.1 hypothetical protein E8M01_06020 [Phreatobacter stygius]
MDTATPSELFTHVRIVLGMVIGVGIARILTGIASFIQHPGRNRVSSLHMLWVASTLIELVLFWWWEFALARIAHWNFAAYLFLISYAVVLFLLAALLFPDNIAEYGGYEDFFIKRRRWFFSLLAVTFAFDVVDTIIKGAEHWNRLSTEYLVQVPLGLTLCAVAWSSKNRNVQIGVVLVHIAYQAYWIVRVINTI